MAYTVAANAQGEYVHVVHSGASDPAEIVAARMEAIELLTARRLRRFLIDLRQVRNAFTTMDHYNLITSALAHSEIIGTPIAVVVDVGDLGDFRFVEDLAINRGLDLKIFTDADAATAWLAGRTMKRMPPI